MSGTNADNGKGKAKLQIGQLTNTSGGMAVPSGSMLNYMNRFVDDSFTEVPQDRNLDFKRHIDKKMEAEKRQNQVALANKRVTGPTGIMTYTKSGPTVPDAYGGLPPGPNHMSATPKTQKFNQRVRKFTINSKRRDTRVYPNIADFKMFLGRSFTNVSQIRMVNLIVPNVDQAINPSCNKFYWINKEDIDLANPYPIYVAEFSRGSYTISTLQSELESKLNNPNIKRRGNLPTSTGDVIPHYFIITINGEKDYVSFTSVKTKKAKPNGITTIQGSGTITVKLDETGEKHGYVDDQRIHIIGVRGTIGGINSSFINGVYNINLRDDWSFTIEISQTATESADGGGSLIRTGYETEWQLLASEYNGNPLNDTILTRLGYRAENSSVSIPASSTVPTLTTVVCNLTGVVTGDITLIQSPNHGLQVGDWVFLYNCHLVPSIYDSESVRGYFQIIASATPDVFSINFRSQRVSDISKAYIGTRIIKCTFENHGFNRIVSITSPSADTVEVMTQFDHNVNVDEGVLIKQSNSVPSIDGFYKNKKATQTVPNPIPNVIVTAPDVFQLKINATQFTTSGFNGIMTTDHDFHLYGVEAFGGFTADELNKSRCTVRNIVDGSTFYFTVYSGFSNKIEGGGGSDIRINSKIHGWNGTHENYVNGNLFRPINLAGANTCYLCLTNVIGDLLMNSDDVKKVICQQYLTTNPGYYIFNQFMTEPLVFDPPLPTLGELHFEWRSEDNYLMEFNGLEWTGAIEITELVPVEDDSLNETLGEGTTSAQGANIYMK